MNRILYAVWVPSLQQFAGWATEMGNASPVENAEDIAILDSEFEAGLLLGLMRAYGYGDAVATAIDEAKLAASIEAKEMEAVR